MAKIISGFSWLDRVLNVEMGDGGMFWVVGIVAQDEERFYAVHRSEFDVFKTFYANLEHKRIKRYKREQDAKAAKTRLHKQLAPQFRDTLFIRRYVSAQVVIDVKANLQSQDS